MPASPGTAAGGSSSRRGPWRRRRAGRLVAGVATGLADHLGVDVVLVRIVIVLVTVLTNGLGLVAYVIAAALVPEGDAATTGDRRWGPVAAEGSAPGQGTGESVAGRDPVFWVGLGALVLGAVWLLGGGIGPIGVGPVVLGRDVILAVLLIGLGLALWRSAGRTRSPLTPSSAAPSRGRPSTAPATAASPPAGPATATTSSAAAPPAGPATATTSSAAAPPPAASDPSSAPSSDPSSAPSSAAASAAVPTSAVPTASFPNPQEPTMAPTGTVQAASGQVGTNPPQPGTVASGGDVGTVAAPGGADTAPPPPAAPAPPTPAWEPPPLPQRPRSLLGQLTVGLALVTAGTLWALELAGVLELGASRILAGALLVLGLGLLVGSVAGRARWLLIPAVVLLPVVIATSLLGSVTLVGLEQGIGDRRPTPETVSELDASYQLAIGSLTLDLTELDPAELAASAAAGEPTQIDVQIGLGELIVLVPDDIAVSADLRAGLGEVVVFDPSGDGRRSADGVGPSVSSTFAPEEPVAELHLDVQLGIGYGEVQLVPAP